MPSTMIPDERRQRLDDSTAASGADTKPESNSRESLDRRLDEGLMETFPASDPVSVIIAE